jgi:hypothetical protein
MMSTICKLYLRTRIPSYGWIAAIAVATFSVGSSIANGLSGMPSGAVYASLSAVIF